MIELIYALLFFGGIWIGLKKASNDQQHETDIIIVTVPPKPDPNLKVAKNTLVSFGYTATEAKKMLQGVTASTPEEYVTKAMSKVKI